MDLDMCIWNSLPANVSEIKLNNNNKNSDIAWHMARLQAWCNIKNYIIMSQRNQPNCKSNVPAKSPGSAYNYDPTTETPIYDI